jgi:hypothetical protein
MVVFGNRRDKAAGATRRRAKVRAAIAFEDAPAIVAAERDDVDFFSIGLTHVTDIKLPCRPIEREPPRIPEAEREDLVASGIGTEERIA